MDNRRSWEDLVDDKAGSKLSPEMIQYLVKHGVDKSSAQNVTARKVVNALMNDEENALMQEAVRQVEQMKSDYESIRKCIEDIGEVVNALAQTTKEFGKATDEKAINALVMYGAMIKMNSSVGEKTYGNYGDYKPVDPNTIIKAASYCVYAYLGGQARRIYGEEFEA